MIPPSTQDARATGLVELAVRCEQATGADRELDVAIVYALHPDIGPYQGHCVGEEPIFWHDPYRKVPCPQFTASLDAAMTLVPEGWRLDHLGEKRITGGCIAVVGSKMDIDADGYGSSGATPALALTATALRALAASTKDQNDDG